MTVYGYTSAESDAALLDQKLVQLYEARCDAVFADKLTALTRKRRQLDRLLANLTEGDHVIVTDLPCVADSTNELLTRVKQVADLGARFTSLNEGWIDTSRSDYQISAIVEGLLNFDQDLLARARDQFRARTTHGNRKLSAAQREDAIRRRLSGDSVSEIAKHFNVSYKTIRRLRPKPAELIIRSDV